VTLVPANGEAEESEAHNAAKQGSSSDDIYHLALSSESKVLRHARAEGGFPLVIDERVVVARHHAEYQVGRLASKAR
jgi:hypothetical protein